ncbi:MAG: hypothetical protein RDV48_25200 [Candidatus Eremiobacteraeota bacterium]|nr:hypothetical protein [Candidatus Eremiobacteraeota bacterium]
MSLKKNAILRLIPSVAVLAALLVSMGTGTCLAQSSIYDDPYDQVKLNTPCNEDGQLDKSTYANVSWEGSKECQCEVTISKTSLTVHKGKYLEQTQYATIGSIDNRHDEVVFHGGKWTVRISKKRYEKARVVEPRKSMQLRDAMVSMGYQQITIAFPDRHIDVAVKETINDLRYNDMVYQCVESNGNYWKVYVKKL